MIFKEPKYIIVFICILRKSAISMIFKELN